MTLLPLEHRCALSLPPRHACIIIVRVWRDGLRNRYNYCHTRPALVMTFVSERVVGPFYLAFLREPRDYEAMETFRT